MEKNNKTHFFYVLYSDKTWVFDQIERRAGSYTYILCYAWRAATGVKRVTQKQRKGRLSFFIDFNTFIREIIFTLVYFHKMAQLLISLITNNTVAVSGIHVTIIYGNWIIDK